ncbi:MAG: hypothetical protein NTY98_03970 [Verrucomicrobia bacterium]|nr:hypothetical protein [Verrucomicrobiota bacterium]
MTPTIATETLLSDLGQLSDIDLAKKRLEPKSARIIELTQEAKGLRTRIPASVLLHYDARLSRGKRGAARMRNNTCGGCNLALPSGQLADMRHVDAALVLCCNCSIYLLPSLPAEADPAAVEAAKPAVAKKVAVKKPRKPKVAKAIAADEAAAAAEEEELETEVESEADAPEESEAASEAPDTTPAEIAADLAVPAEAQAEEEAEAEIALPA